MNFYSLSIIALALSLDAFGVSVSLGLNGCAEGKKKFYFISSFAFFQFAFALIGALFGILVNTYIVSIPQIIGGIIIALVGVMMIKEGMDESSTFTACPRNYLLLGVSVSIDAMVIGFTALNNISSKFIIFQDSLYIGIVTFVMSSIAFLFSDYLKKIHLISEYADYIGGIILIIFGIKMMFV